MNICVVVLIFAFGPVSLKCLLFGLFPREILRPLLHCRSGMDLIQRYVLTQWDSPLASVLFSWMWAPKCHPSVLGCSEEPFCGHFWDHLGANRSSSCTLSLLPRETILHWFCSCLLRFWCRDFYHFCSSKNYFCPWLISVCLAWFSWSLFTASWSYFYNILRWFWAGTLA